MTLRRKDKKILEGLAHVDKIWGDVGKEIKSLAKRGWLFDQPIALFNKDKLVYVVVTPSGDLQEYGEFKSPTKAEIEKIRKYFKKKYKL